MRPRFCPGLTVVAIACSCSLEVNLSSPNQDSLPVAVRVHAVDFVCQGCGISGPARAACKQHCGCLVVLACDFKARFSKPVHVLAKDIRCAEIFAGVASIAKGFRNLV